MNAKNLKKINLSHEEATKNGKKGGEASVKARRKKKEMKAMFQYILQLDVKDNDLRAEMRNMGIADEQMTINALACYAMVRKAIGGDTKAAEFIATMTGQKPQDKLKVEGKLEGTIDRPITIPKALQNATMEELRDLGALNIKIADTTEYDTEETN